MIRTILHRASVWAIIYIALCLYPQVARGCGCIGDKNAVLDDYERADVVVIARLVSTEKFGAPNPMYLDNIRAFTMVVEKIFKGSVKVQDRLRFEQGNGIDCLWTLFDESIGSEFLLYLNQPQEVDSLWAVWGCGRSKALSVAADDLLYLNNIHKAHGRTRISGTYGDAEDSDIKYEGKKIRVIGRNKTYVATTDKNGVYELYDVPPGTYLLEPEVPFGCKVDEFDLTRPSKRSDYRPPGKRVSFTLQPRRHFGIKIKIRLSNHVSGVIHDSSGKPMQWVCVSLARVDDERYLACNDLTDKLGHFQIDSLAAGSYVLILNYEDKKTSKMPFPKLYYPGVTDRGMATVFNIKHGESLSSLNLRIPIDDSSLLIEGVVLFADGTRAIRQRVRLRPSTGTGSEREVSTYTNIRGHFSLRVLKGLTGELYSSFALSDSDVAKCPKLGSRLKSSGENVVFDTQHIKVDGGNSMSGLRLKFPVSPCMRK
jgi:hypothetical protein